MDDHEPEYLFRTKITVRNVSGEITNILEMPDGSPFATIGFLAHFIGGDLQRCNEDIHISVEIKALDNAALSEKGQNHD